MIFTRSTIEHSRLPLIQTRTAVSIDRPTTIFVVGLRRISPPMMFLLARRWYSPVWLFSVRQRMPPVLLLRIPVPPRLGFVPLKTPLTWRCGRMPTIEIPIKAAHEQLPKILGK